jgi:hypothetical protein
MDFNFKEFFGIILLILGTFISVGTGLAFCAWILKTVV